jgi:putative ABC transport system permease protein
MGFSFADGTDFDKSMLTQLDSSIFIILNKSAVKALGWENPVGMKIYSSPIYKLRKGKCAGVVNDFHVASLHDEIPPLVISLGTKGFNFLSVKIRPENRAATISYIESVWKTFSQGYPFDYTFLDESFGKQYSKEERMSVLFTWFSGICIFISCLGLMGLTSFAIKQRTREIGIRKIAGATVGDLVFLLQKDFLKLVLAAFLVAIPVAGFAMHKWLQGFAYRTDMGWMVFAIPGIMALLVAILTISLQTIRAANTNPSKVLQYE